MKPVKISFIEYKLPNVEREIVWKQTGTARWILGLDCHHLSSFGVFGLPNVFCNPLNYMYSCLSETGSNNKLILNHD